MNNEKLHVIVLRSDLDNRKIQSSSKSIGFRSINGEMGLDFPAKLKDSFHFGVNIIGLPVYGEKELFLFYEETKKNYPWIPIRLVLDSDKERCSKPTYSYLSIGPFEKKEIEKIIKRLSFCIDKRHA